MKTPESIDELMTIGLLLIEDIEGQLASDKCKILRNGTDDSIHRLYTCLSLAHCTRVLRELGVAVDRSQEISLRALSRVHTEAFLIGAYLRFGGIDSVMRIYEAAKSDDVKLRNVLKQWNTELGAKIKRANRSRRAISMMRNNLEVARALGRRSVRGKVPNEPSLPRRNFAHNAIQHLESTNKDLDDRSSTEFSVKQVVDWLAKEGPVQGFATQDFEPIYHCYRLMSSIGIHTTMNVLEHYMDKTSSSSFFGVLSYPGRTSAKGQALWDGVFGTAQLAEWDLTFLGCNGSLAAEVRAAMEPGKGNDQGWRAF
jgi:hypothetical protein